MKKIAIVHDWLTNMGGAEQVVINFHELYPEAPIYTTFYSPNNLRYFDTFISDSIYFSGIHSGMHAQKRPVCTDKSHSSTKE